MSGGGSERVFMYAVGELSNTVTAYAVTYSGVGLEFEEIDSIDTFGGKGVPLGAGAAEIAILVCISPLRALNWFTFPLSLLYV